MVSFEEMEKDKKQKGYTGTARSLLLTFILFGIFLLSFSQPLSPLKLAKGVLHRPRLCSFSSISTFS